MKWCTALAGLMLLLILGGVAAFSQPATWNDIAGFESSLPSFWTIGSAPTGATLTWATDQARTMGHSLKIVKPGATTDSAAWVSENMADVWSPTFSKNVDILLGAYVKTQGVNTAPADDDARWFVVYTFYDKSGTVLNETRLPVDQATATSTGWVADTNQVGETILSDDATKLIVKFVAGKNATGTVWADDFVFYARTGWAGQDWNTSVGVPTGWFYWLPPNGGNDGVLNSGFENTVVTSEAAHSGTNSLKFVMPAGRQSHDGFVGTRRMSFADLGVPNLKPGDSVRVSVWVKASGLQPDSAAVHQGTWNVGLTGLFFSTVDPSAGYNPTGPDSTFRFPNVTSFDWTQYSTVFVVPTDSLPTTGGNKGPVMGMEVRMHVYATFVGTVYFDDVTLQRVSKTTAIEPVPGNDLPKVYELSNNYPNPFNPSTTIQYAVPRVSNVSLVIYNVLGQKIRTLVDQPQNAGRFNVTWDGRDNVGHVVGSGVYFYRLNAGETSLVKKMLMLK
jgi:hypothetical protein